MKISKEEYVKEEQKLQKTISIIREKISNLGEELLDRDEKVLEFKKFMWDSHTELDPGELKTMMSDNDLEISLMMNKGAYLQKLFKVQNKPYFGSFNFKDEKEENNIYLGITHVEDNLNYLVHDWRSPICSLFYDYELGEAMYDSPSGLIKGQITKKRQYQIEDGKLKHIFDNEINIDDELLQEVLATNSSDKMKNIVNTIQQEQNKVIRDTNHDNLIVEGIAGSGKTSVALHRIAFLLYKLNYLNENNVLIFSPNNIFSEYISNVLPELGENNTMQTTFHDFLKSKIKEYKEVESFTSFIERYYKYHNINFDLIKYKQSDNIIKDLDNYIKDLETNTIFIKDLITKEYLYTKEELNELLKKYNHFPLFKRIDFISEKICDKNFEGKLTKKKSILKNLYECLSIKKDYKTIYNNFYLSKHCQYKTLTEDNIKTFTSKKTLNYEDACLFIYLKSNLEGFDYNTTIRQIVIDEAQDYTKLQYLLLTKLFKNANYTILGDTNQTINPYYKYNNLNEISSIIPNTHYVPLTKTYRSSSEIIEYTNAILNLNHISAIRRSNNKKVIERQEENNLKELLIKDINNLKKESKSIAIICKNDIETDKIYELLNNEMNITKITTSTNKFEKSLVIIPSYIAKGLEFDSVIIYTDLKNKYTATEKNLFYVSCTRSQHQLIVYNQK